jgi:DNA polymerase III subunit gamma/tau
LKNFTGRIIGDLTLIAPSGVKKKWLCRCTCGKELDISTCNLQMRGKTRSCGCKVPPPHKLSAALTGDVFGKLVVLAEGELICYPSGKIKRQVWVQCECGKPKKLVSATSLTQSTNPIRSCGCESRLKYLYAGESAFQRVWNQYKSNCRLKQRNFDLTRERFKQYLQQECYYCGVPPAQVSKVGTNYFLYNGIDRLDSKLGYFLDNCISCCRICNQAKSTMSPSEFLAWTSRVAARRCSLIVPPPDFDPINYKFLGVFVNQRNLISQRPNSWSEVVGQQRALDVLHAVLRNPNFLTRGIIFHGVVGVGKTSTAYLTAKGLMCTGSDPLGCGKCPSCETIAQDGIDAHPDFQEIDAAQSGGVEAAREVVDTTLSLPALGKRRVSVIDEAPFLSSEAWGVYLKILEQSNTDAVFIFISNELEKIKMATITRCIRIPFARVSNDVMKGHLSKIATANGIDYELEALDIIVRHSRGVVREAVQCLNMAAALGKVRPQLVQTVIDSSLEDRCTHLLHTIGKKNQVEACKQADEMTLNASPQRIIETLLSVYGRAIWTEDPLLQQVYVGLPNVEKVTDILVKWSSLTLPADVLVIIVWELLQTQVQQQRSHATAPVTSLLPKPIMRQPKNTLSAFLEEEAI